jgi:drug/metabolite transporter (DMT)-like permease
MLAGLALVGGLTGARAYGAHPALGVLEGLGVALLYAAYIFILREATASSGRPSAVATLYEATLGAAAGSLVLGLGLHDLRPWPTWHAIGWLVLLAVTSQVIGWLLITVSMPGLPAWMIGVVLLIQPAGSVTLGYLILAERPSATQLAGVVLMLAGVLLAVRNRQPAPRRSRQATPRRSRQATQDEDHPPGTGRVERDVAVEVAITGHELKAPG